MLPVAPLALAAVLVGPLAVPGTARRPALREDDYTAPRNATVDARGARRVEIDAGAGSLRVTGVPGLTEARVHGTARASREAWLADIRLVARRDGDAVVIRAEIPDENGRDADEGWNGGNRALDLEIEVPSGLAARVTDGSGEAEVRGVGALELRDGSGELTVDDVASADVTDGSGGLRIGRVRGDVRLSDGSGEITVRDVDGSVTVTEDGSGEIDAEHVKGGVRVERDGSGGIDVRDVGGDFVVERDGSGGIDYSDVRGRVSVPRGR